MTPDEKQFELFKEALKKLCAEYGVELTAGTNCGDDGIYISYSTSDEWVKALENDLSSPL